MLKGQRNFAGNLIRRSNVNINDILMVDQLIANQATDTLPKDLSFPIFSDEYFFLVQFFVQKFLHAEAQMSAIGAVIAVPLIRLFSIGIGGFSTVNNSRNDLL